MSYKPLVSLIRNLSSTVPAGRWGYSMTFLLNVYHRSNAGISDEENTDMSPQTNYHLAFSEALDKPNLAKSYLSVMQGLIARI